MTAVAIRTTSTRDSDVLAPLLDRWRRGEDPYVAGIHVVPERTGRVEPWPEWLGAPVRERLAAQGIRQPWTHQVATAQAVRARENVVAATGTSSGKSLGYLLPIAQNALTDACLPPARRRTALYLAPTKALAHDQLRALRELDLPGLDVATLDGDSTTAEREWARRSASYVLTNPDMLHHSILPAHERHRRLLAHLDVIVIDECHHYRGVFGSHVAQVLRRLRRLCRHYGADPVFVLASATVGEPAISAQRLIGSPVRAVTDDASPRGELSFVLVDPSTDDSEGGRPMSAHTYSSRLLAELVSVEARTVAFVRARRTAETVASETRDRLRNGSSSTAQLAGRVAAYRGGLLPEERREVERALSTGELLAVASTNALELGVDIAGLDAVILSGFPGTRASLWQQVGRAGRRGRPALAVLVAGADPLDAYLVRHPELLFERELEVTAFDPDNPHIVAPHIVAAAAELPLTDADAVLFGPAAPRLLDELAQAGVLRRRSAGWFWTRRQRASDLADIRGAGAPAVTIVEDETGRLLGTVDAAASHSAVHEGAVYLHQGESYLVRSLDDHAGVALCDAATPEYSTSARSVTSIQIDSVSTTRCWGAGTVHFGHVTVTGQVVGYLRRRNGTGEVLGESPLDLPERSLATTSVWWTLTPEAVVASGLQPGALPGAAHAAEHAAIGLLPLFAACDRWDIGGVSTACHPETGTVTVFVHDGYPGGAGISERGFERVQAWLTATRQTIAACTCIDGCPACVQAPKCGNANNPLDKAGSIRLLDTLLAGAPGGSAGGASAPSGGSSGGSA